MKWIVLIINVDWFLSWMNPEIFPRYSKNEKVTFPPKTQIWDSPPAPSFFYLLSFCEASTRLWHSPDPYPSPSFRICFTSNDRSTSLFVTLPPSALVEYYSSSFCSFNWGWLNHFFFSLWWCCWRARPCTFCIWYFYLECSRSIWCRVYLWTFFLRRRAFLLNFFHKKSNEISIKTLKEEQMGRSGLLFIC